ncbi:N-6 DNA methylase [Rahnella perminowiae]|uniref:Eco57I restriction-modification methylase domain-containing protein n=1 Tax=Rahnella perminowiae TaxID=2816244 RepID=UPI00224B9410|nr:N-6 DNA methylase [Rahnella perminowiae]MCX2941503.1 N-6 DNA methylase [Rahnella perminowiae]
MRQPLDKILRKKLEDTVVKARDIVEVAVDEALQRLGVADSQAPGYLNDEQRALRNTLRAHARQLGDKLTDGKQEIERLANEMAYEHWHRMLFARYLEQNNLLMYDDYTSVTLDECFELAEEGSDCKDGWELAGRLAQKMLPQIFRADSPVFAVKLAINHINELENLISELAPDTYQAQDSLGWCYQFWQNKKKKQVNDSGVKIGAQELSPVTQLFTEPYMVSFLLDNALGAWWANKCLTQDDYIRANNEYELRDKASIPGVPLEYLRFIKNDEIVGQQRKWTLAAGDYEKWPEHLSQLKMLDPCCGSGHFLVGVFLMLVPMRIRLEGLSAKEAVDAVLQDNIYGLELDQRCVELAAFALALEAWRYPNAGGYRVLPELQLACSGISIAEAQKEWKELAKGDDILSEAITWLQGTFSDAPTLGSLIDPIKDLNTDNIPPWLLLNQAMANRVKASYEAKAAAQELAKTASILVGKYQWVITNVPYLARGKQCSKLKLFCESFYNDAKKDLATVFLSRSLNFCIEGGSTSIVLPQNWLFLTSYKKFRKNLLKHYTWNIFARLGAKGFQTPMWDFNVQLISISRDMPNINSLISGIDVGNEDSFDEKARALSTRKLKKIVQINQLNNPDYAVVLDNQVDTKRLSDYAAPFQGIKSGDDAKLRRVFWELGKLSKLWKCLQTTLPKNKFFGGFTSVISWYQEGIELARKQGLTAWGRKGVAVSQMSSLPVSLYYGDAFDSNTCPIIPQNNNQLPAIWAYVSSPDFCIEVRKIDQKVAVANATMAKPPFDLAYWSEVAKKQYPNGLPQLYSDDPTQWIFHGHPCASVVWNKNTKITDVGEFRQDNSVPHVAIARLVGYQWPAESDPDMELASEMRLVMKKNADFDYLVDDDGIVCIPAVRGEKTAAKRLTDILYKAYGDAWSSSVEDNLLKSANAKDWESWLRDKFFEQHCKLFQHRPFIWHIWDGLKDGFSALVNYHKLDYKGLERLIYTYLDDWISIQKRNIADGVDGADIRLIAAENLKEQLEAILEGEKGLDIFVRWKALEEQPIGWNPDINDGVRLNIRPFMLAKDVGKKGAGVLRVQPNIHWKKDRGTDVESAPWYKLGLQYGGNLGDRINDHHLTLAEKREARENKGL